VVSFQGSKAVKGTLQVNPKYVPAMVGIGLASLVQDNADGARKAAEQALQVNPNSVEALELLAMASLAKDDTAKAVELCRKALAVNPCSMKALATMAACDPGDGSIFKDAEKKALETNPKCSTFYNDLADRCVSKYMMAEATKFYEKAIELDPSNWQACVGMGMHLFRVGDETKAKEYLDKAYEKDKFHVWNRNTLTLMDSFETAFTLFKTEHLDVRIDNNDRDLMQGYLGDLLEKIYADLSARYKYEVKGRMLFELYDKHSDFSVRTLGVPGLGALGVCFGNVFVSLSPEARKQMSAFNWGSVVAHEFAHVFTLNMSNFKVPRWFTEGCSVYAEKTCGSGWDRELELDIYNAYCSGNLMRIPQLKSIFDLLHIYELSSVIIEHIDKTRGFDKVIAMLKLWGEGKGDEEVFKTALGMSIEEFDKEFFDYLVNDWFKRFKVRPPVNRKTVTAAALRERIAKNQKDVEALATLARILLEDEKPQDAKEYALKAIAIDPKNTDALTVMGYMDFDKRKFKEAADWYEKSIAAGSDDFGTHFRLARCYQKLEKTDLYERELIAAKKSFPRYVAAGDNPYALLAALYKEKGRVDDMLRELAELDGIDHLDPRPKMELAALYKDRNESEKMVEVLKKVIFIDPKDIKLHVYLGEGLRAMGRHEEALKEEQLAMLLIERINKDGRCDKLIAERYCAIAETYLSLGNNEKALEALNQALITYPACETQVNEIRQRIGQ
jgi:tetratricopeptide (TPR) repeat protein